MTEIVRRHEILRAAFPAVDGQPVLVIDRDSALKLARVAARDVNESDQLDWARHACEAECRQPFDLATGPLFRFTIFILSKTTHVILFTFHHSIFDGSCVDLLLNEFASLYKSRSEGEPSSLPDLPIQYSDFIHFQRQKLQGKFLKGSSPSGEQLWKIVRPASLPTDHPPAPTRTTAGVDYRWCWGRV